MSHQYRSWLSIKACWKMQEANYRFNLEVNAQSINTRKDLDKIRNMGDFFMFQSNKLKNHRPTCSFLELRSSMLLLIMFVCKNCVSFKINFRLCVLIFKRFAKPLNNTDFFFFKRKAFRNVRYFALSNSFHHSSWIWGLWIETNYWKPSDCNLF